MVTLPKIPVPRTGRPPRKAAAKPESGHGPIRQVALHQIEPSPENDKLYRPVDPNDPDILTLAQSIRQHGVKEPLVLSADFFILSGHRRYVAAFLAGLASVPCRFETVTRGDGGGDEFVKLLRKYNRQREKTRDEKLREAVVEADPTEAYKSLTEFRRQQADVSIAAEMEIGDVKVRATISKAKSPFLKAVQAVLTDRRKYWPLSDRQIHYALLNSPPLRHASKPDSIYDNTPQSYKSLVDLLTRARLTGVVPWGAIADETRPVTRWDVHRETGTFLRKEMSELLKGYWRDLMQSQPNHVEIVGEKNTVRPILQTVAGEYRICLTTGRGYCSLPPRYEIAKRFRQSGKESLVLLLVTDFDPDGEEIAQSFARSMRDDFGVSHIKAMKVALNADQVADYVLPPVMTAKETSAHFDKFTKRHGHNVYELEALPPPELQALLRQAIDSVIDTEAFNAELDAERKDAGYLEGVRRTVHATLGDLGKGSDQRSADQ